jgi:flavin reductase (DIM6/NTAB) family NADH-FMN oxidoreductase RutF
MKKQPNRIVHEVLRQIPYGLYVVGVCGNSNGAFNALVVSWLTQCSFEPPLIVIAVRKDSRSYELIKKGRAFSVNFIDKTQRSVVRQLVKPAHGAGEKLRTVAHVEEHTGAPILREAFAYAECKVREIHEPGDHAMVIGEVVGAAKRGAGEQMMCSDLRWHYGG